MNYVLVHFVEIPISLCFGTLEDCSSAVKVGEDRVCFTKPQNMNNNMQAFAAPIQSSTLGFSGEILGKNGKSEEEIFLLISTTKTWSFFLFAR